MLDATSHQRQLGKTAGRDAALAKSTYVSLLGVEAAPGRRRDSLADRAVEHLERAGFASGSLAALAEYIVTRES